MPDDTRSGADALPDGLAAGKGKLLQVNTVDRRTGAEEPPVIFQYYTEYGDDCVVVVRSEGQEAYLPAQALLAFADHFRRELGGPT